MKKTIVISLLIFLFSIVGYAQDAFRVVIVRGECLLVINDKEKTPIKKGDKLLLNQKIETAEGCYLALIHKTGKPFEIRKQGNYSVSELENKMLQSTLNKTLKYTDELVSALDNIGNPYYKTAGQTDNTERTVDNSKIPSYCPKQSSFINYELNFSWVPLPNTQSYKLTIYDMGEDVLKEFEVTGTEFKYNIQPLLKGQNRFIWQVVSVQNPELASKMHVLSYIDNKIAKDVEIELNEIKKEIDANSALSQLILAMYFEKNKLYLEASEAFKNAIKLEPTVSEYKESYNDFLVRHGLNTSILK
jgi:hypothetical protein